MAGKAKPRVFLDSNVVFAGLYSGEGAPGAILEHGAEGKFSLVISRQVLDELVRTIAAKLPGALPALHTFLLSTPLEVCEEPAPRDVKTWSQLVGEDDAPIAAAAAIAEVDFLVSGDRHLLKAEAAARKRGLRIISPSAFLRESS
jgi:predicted nucleic acid-binding protein